MGNQRRITWWALRAVRRQELFNRWIYEFIIDGEQDSPEDLFARDHYSAPFSVEDDDAEVVVIPRLFAYSVRDARKSLRPR